MFQVNDTILVKTKKSSYQIYEELKVVSIGNKYVHLVSTETGKKYKMDCLLHIYEEKSNKFFGKYRI